MLKKNIVPATISEELFKEMITQKPKELFHSNSKLKKDGIFQWSIPAYKAKVFLNNEFQMVQTCPNAGICLNFCYASSGNFVFKNVLISHHRNLNYILNSPKEFIQEVTKEIHKKKIQILRIHDSGDFFSESYLNIWLKVIEENPNVQFYCYTKNIPLFRGLKIVPKNFTHVFSFGGNKDSEIDLKTDRYAKIFKTEEMLTEQKFHNVSKSDLKASNKRIKKIGLIAHGSFVVKRKLNKMNDLVSG